MRTAPIIQKLSDMSISFLFSDAGKQDHTTVIFRKPDHALVLNTVIDLDMGEAKVADPITITPAHPNATIFELLHAKLTLQGGNPPPFGRSR